MPSHLMLSHQSIDWGTPLWLKSVLQNFYGHAPFDPCPLYGKEYGPNGLDISWEGDAYINPPWGKGIEEWINKAMREYLQSHVNSATMLVPNHTETRWFKLLWHWDVLVFLHGRLQFVGASTNGATCGSVLAYVGPEAEQFARALYSYGQPMISAIGGRKQ